jgi:uncharacterized membrane protein YhhN
MKLVKVLWWATLVGGLVAFLVAQLVAMSPTVREKMPVGEEHLFNDAKVLLLANLAISGGLMVKMFKKKK